MINHYQSNLKSHKNLRPVSQKILGIIVDITQYQPNGLTNSSLDPEVYSKMSNLTAII